jgi:MFS family permease
VSLYFAAQDISALQWSRLSDKVGRKPVLLFGLLGTIVSSLLFGLSRSFWALAFRSVWLFSQGIIYSNWVITPSRCLNGMLNGNIAVMQSMLAELTDETNVARGCSLRSVTWAVVP